MQNNKRLVFIASSGRSGSTLLRNILNIHEEVGVLPELRFFDIILSNIKRYNLKDNESKNVFIKKIHSTFRKSSDPCWKNKNIEFDFLKNELRDFDNIKDIYCRLIELYVSKKNSLVVVDKVAPMFIANVLKIFPDAKFIQIVRDGREVYASSAKKGWIDNCIYLPVLWNESIRYFLKYKKKYVGNDFWEFRYEDLISNSEKNIRDIFSFIKVSNIEDGFLNKVEEMSSFSSFSDKKKLKGLYVSKHFSEMFDKTKQEKITYLLSPGLRKWGYGVKDYKFNFILKFKYLVCLIIFRIHYYFKVKGKFWIYNKLKKYGQKVNKNYFKKIK